MTQREQCRRDLQRVQSLREERRAYRINDFCSAFGLGRTKVYELIASGKLRTVLVGGRRLIPAEAAEALLQVEA